MIVELIGSSGAGKTTLAEGVREQARSERPFRLAVELVMDRAGRRWIANPHAMNLVADVVTLPPFLGAWSRNREFVGFALDRLKRHAPSRFAKLNYAVNVVRRTGMYELARRQGADPTILADEGTVLMAYQLFVYNAAPLDPADIERFAEIVPMPDRIVYVRAPIDVLVDRAMGRRDRRRELATGDHAQVERWMVRARDVFDALAAVPRIRDRLLVVDNGDPQDQRAAIERIAAFIDEGRSVGLPRDTRGTG
jgi:thymidylate kinase